MFQTLIHFNPSSPHAQRLLDQPYRIHYMLEHINTSRQRILWRLSEDRLLVRHTDLLDWTELDKTHPNFGDRSHTKLNLAFPTKSVHLFNLFAFICKPDENGKWKTQQAEQYIDWIYKRSPHIGIELLETQIAKAPEYFVRMKNAQFKAQPMRIAGILQVTNTTALLNIQQTGVGKMRAYGCGMLLLQPMEPIELSFDT